MKYKLNEFRALGENILLEKDQSKIHGLIHIPDAFARASPMARVVSIGDKVPIGKYYKGTIIIAKVGDAARKETIKIIGGDGIERESYVTNYKNVIARMVGSMVAPYGRRVLVKRVMDQHQHSKILVTPEAAKENYQSLLCEIVRYGIVDGGFGVQLKEGTRCKIRKWEQNMVELGLPSGYHLVVDVKDLEYYYE